LISQSTKRISAESERLELDEKHILRDETNVAEEKLELEQTISQQTTETETLKNNAAAKLEVVSGEIAELEETLARKRAERDAIKSSLSMHEDAITTVRAKFDRQLQRLGVRESAANDARQEWEVENGALGSEREDLERQKNEQSRKAEDHENMLKRIESEAVEIECLAGIFGNLPGIEGDEEGGEGSVDDDGAEDDNRIKIGELSGVTDQVNACEAKHSEFSGEIREIQLLIPNLESEKANAAKTRNFKAAAQVSKDLIAKKERLSECETLLSGEIETELNGLREKESKLKVELEAAEQNSRKKKKERVLKTIDKMVVNVRSLKAHKRGESPGWSLLAGEIGARVGNLRSLCETNEIDFDELDLGSDGSVEQEVEVVVAVEVVVEETAVESELEPTDVESEVETEVETENELEVEPIVETEPEPVPEPTVDPAIERYNELTTEIASTEAAIESAVDAEDYELAADLDEKIGALRDERDKLRVKP